MTATSEAVAVFERFMWERFGIEPGIAPDGTRYFERWQIEEALQRSGFGVRPRRRCDERPPADRDRSP